jgi:hypothetical protein
MRVTAIRGIEVRDGEQDLHHNVHYIDPPRVLEHFTVSAD